MMIKLLLDTDIGTDVDDAVALAYLLAQPECDLIGITTVSGEAEKRAALASVLCKAAGRDVPIYPGAETTLAGQPWQNKAPQAAALPRWPHETIFPQGEAILFMNQAIHSHPGEIVLVATGPLSNIGRLFREDPEIPSLLKGIFVMGGCYGNPPPELVPPGQVEWNVAGDTQAAQVVYRAPVPLHRTVGLNVSQQVVMSAGEVRQRFTAPLLRPVLEMAEIWFRDFYPAVTFHDPLTAAIVFSPELCAFEWGTVTIITGESPARTAWQPGGPGSPHEVAIKVDVAGYFLHFFSVFHSRP